jgi:hypothetical protein
MVEPGCIRGFVLLSETSCCKMKQEKEYDTFRRVATVCWQHCARGAHRPAGANAHVVHLVVHGVLAHRAAPFHQTEQSRQFATPLALPGKMFRTMLAGVVFEPF